MTALRPDPAPLHCALCIVGAGLSGLNALFAAAQYLPRGARVVLVDRRGAPGGMWADCYDFVRLHQPHRMFTVGDLPWRPNRPGGYLATGQEVLGHLADCLDRLRGGVEVIDRFGHEYLSHSETETQEGPQVRVSLRRVGGGAIERIEAERLIVAAGWDIPKARLLEVSSRRVRSVTPETLAGAVAETDPATPVIIVGGGKTGMDTAHWLITRDPGRKITLVNGTGTTFASRDLLFPTGARRWLGGVMVSALSADVTRRFDGRNAGAVFDHFQRAYGIDPVGKAGQYFFSMLSEAEAGTIARGLGTVIRGHLADVADTGTGPEMVLRDGARHPVPPGSLLVNCTGYLLRHDRPYAPYLSPGGRVLTVTSRSSVYFLSSTAAYFLTHMLYLGRLAALPLYELDVERLFRIDRKLFFATCLTHAFHNMLVVMESAPLSVFARCGLDLNRWYPLPRRLAALARLKASQAGHRTHCRAALDRVRADHGIRCGPLPAAT